MKKNSQKIEEVLTKGVEKILPSKEGLLKLMKKRKISLYLGIDPTGPNLHLGHAIPLRKLKEFQKLGHKIILLFGTFTAQIGDPSLREEKRKPLTLAEVKKNLKGYKKQVSKILDLQKVEIKYNADWLSKLTLKDLNEISSHFTVSRLFEREMFQKRIKRGKEVWLNEFLYPLFQGYDSVVLNVDLEIGSNDQLFNMLVGRKLQKIYNKKEKFILTTKMLLGLDGRKMSKTYQNTVNLGDSPKDIYGKIMSLKDELIISYFELASSVPLAEIKKMAKKLKAKKVNPRDLKAKLAQEIVSLYYGKKAAQEAKREFDRIFREKKLPLRIPKIEIKKKTLSLLDLLTKTKMALSKSEAKRLIIQGGVKIDNKRQDDWKKKIKARKGMIIQVGKRKFAKIA